MVSLTIVTLSEGQMMIYEGMECLQRRNALDKMRPGKTLEDVLEPECLAAAECLCLLLLFIFTG